jgi:hypothetical protein
MAATAEKTNPELWERVKKRVTEGDKGGKPGQWSARKAQLAVSEYEREGGGFKGEKGKDNHLVQWEREEWGTKSGRESLKTGERYLPKKARESLTDAEYKRTTAKKRADTRAGKQHSAQPHDVAGKAAAARRSTHTKSELMAQARERGIPGRSRMSKEQLAHALGRAS